MKRSPLRRKTALKPGRGLVRVPLRQKQGTEMSAGWARSRRWCFDRAKGRCEARCATGCSGYAEHAHHIVLRSQGGSDGVENLLAVCHCCHDWIHGHRAEARAHGWIIDRKTA